VAPCGRCYVSQTAPATLRGAIASRLVIDAVLEEMNRSDGFSADILQRSFALAQARIIERQVQRRRARCNECDVAALLVDLAGRRAVWVTSGTRESFISARYACSR